jgi:hypothetical protein
MPSLPPRDGVDALLCAGIRAGTSTISPVNLLSGVAGKSLPPPPTGEHDAIGGPSGIFLWPPCALREHWGGSPHTRPHDCLYGSMAPSPATIEATPPLPSLAYPSPPARSYPPTHTKPWWGFPKGQWHPRLLPQRRQRHCRAQPILSCRLGLLPPTLYQRWGGAPPRRQAVLCLAVSSIWHLSGLQTHDLLIKIHG